MNPNMRLEANDMSVRLEQGIRLNDFIENKEVELIVSDNQQQAEPEEEEYFEPEDVFQNVYHGDEDDSTDGENDDRSEFERMALKMVDITDDGGVLKKILKPGMGNVVVPGALCRVHYNAYLEYADEPFDSSRLRNDVQKFRLGEGEVVAGFDRAVATMKKGELARFLIKPEYAYGPMGCPPRIPADATLMYKIEMMSFVEKAGVDDYYSMTNEEKRNLSFEELKKVCSSEKAGGHEYYNSKNYSRAFRQYRMALKVMEDAHLKDAKEEREQKDILRKLYLNCALCCQKTGEIRHALVNCSRAYRINDKDVKVLYHYGKSCRLNSEFERSRKYLLQARNLEPHNTDINNELKALDRAVSMFRDQEIKICRRMMSNFSGNTEENKSQKTESLPEECSAEFRRNAHDSMMRFKNDNCIFEMPLPYLLSPPEILCIQELATELDLVATQRGTGNSTHLLIKKKKD